ncbi:hypothetical protein ACIRL0_32765 [Streptomyces sp. NPDC102365]|uniref:DUF7144 family membrane protein n=1 Tax=Streptomyces sp. NPDC102365 TaxID=3366162 RepID=UPI00380AE809
MADTSARYRRPEAGRVAVVGVTPVAVGAGLLAGVTWARIAGVLTGALAITVHLPPIPYSLLWSMPLIALCGLVVRGGCGVRRESLYPWLRGLS